MSRTAKEARPVQIITLKKPSGQIYQRNLPVADFNDTDDVIHIVNAANRKRELEAKKNEILFRIEDIARREKNVARRERIVSKKEQKWRELNSFANLVVDGLLVACSVIGIATIAWFLAAL